MEQPTQFGGFLLFKKSDANAYRTAYRAGVSRGRTIDRIVRIEVFDGPDVDAGRLAASLEASHGLHERLEDPHIAKGAGLGLAGDVPYAAYDFELGVTLASFLDLARSKSFPVPFDQALFIVERIALALAAGYRIEHDGGPVHHTFLTPDSVLLSSQGEVKVLGFETAAALREQFAASPPYAAYLAPECRTGNAPGSRSDVFSLGAILFELVSGKPYVPDEAGGSAEGLVVEATGEPGSDGLRRLLEASFAPRSKRIADVLEWQQNLGKLILAGEYNPTTFNLAFLMHTIMRDRLELDVAEIRREKNYLLTRETESELAAEESSRKMLPEISDYELEETGPEPATAAPDPLPFPAPVAEPSTGSDRRPFWLGFAISALVGGGVLGVLLASGGPGSTELTEAVVASNSRPKASFAVGSTGESQAQAEPRPTADPVEADASDLVVSDVVNGELGEPTVDEQELERLVAERAREIERSLKAEYESKLATLEQRPDEAPQSATPAAVLPGADGEPATATASERPPADVASTDIGETASQAIPANALPRTTESPRPEERPAGSGESSLPEPVTSQARSEEPIEIQKEAADDARAEASVEAPAVAVPAPVVDETAAPEPSPLQSEKAPEPSPVLVTDPPRLLRLGTLNYPPVARRLGLSARVRVKVKVGLDGKVSAAELLEPELGYGFDAAALATVRRSRWTPATQDGEAVEAWTSVTVDFRP